MRTCKPDLRSRESNCRSTTRRCRYAISFPAPRNIVAGLQFGIADRLSRWTDVIPLSVPRSVCKSARDSTFAVVFGVWRRARRSRFTHSATPPALQKSVAQRYYFSMNGFILLPSDPQKSSFFCAPFVGILGTPCAPQIGSHGHFPAFR